MDTPLSKCVRKSDAAQFRLAQIFSHSLKKDCYCVKIRKNERCIHERFWWQGNKLVRVVTGSDFEASFYEADQVFVFDESEHCAFDKALSVTQFRVDLLWITNANQTTGSVSILNRSWINTCSVFIVAWRPQWQHWYFLASCAANC